MYFIFYLNSFFKAFKIKNQIDTAPSQTSISGSLILGEITYLPGFGSRITKGSVYLPKSSL